jgi:hypothetical protein
MTLPGTTLPENGCKSTSGSKVDFQNLTSVQQQRQFRIWFIPDGDKMALSSAQKRSAQPPEQMCSKLP